MRLAHILVCHSVLPDKLFDSIPHQPDAKWYVYLHGPDADLGRKVAHLVEERQGNLFPFMTNRGLARSWNDAIHQAIADDCDAFLLLNDDLFFYEESYDLFFTTIRYHKENSSNIAYISTHGRETGASPHSGQIIPQGFACCALTSEVVDRIGYFDENLIPAYYEDVDYAWRAHLAGLKPFIDPRTLVEHERSSTFNLMSIEDRERASASAQANREYFLRKWGSEHGSFLNPFANASFGPRISFEKRGEPYGAGFDTQTAVAHKDAVEDTNRSEDTEVAPAADEFLRKSYSQFGEDGVLSWLFNQKKNGFYVDVGCHHPRRISNTALLHIDHGWTGINIDVDDRAIAAFTKERPNDINICVGVAATAGKMDVTIFDEGAINSFDEASANHPAWAHIPRTKRSVDVLPLRDILRAHMSPGRTINFMNVDAEAMDYEVLSSNDWDSFSPEVIAVEAHDFDMARPQLSRTFDLLAGKGFRVVSHVAITTIYSRL